MPIVTVASVFGHRSSTRPPCFNVARPATRNRPPARPSARPSAHHQCIVLLFGEGFEGLAPACSVQAWYTGLYLYAWPVIIAVVSLLTSELVSASNGYADAKMADHDRAVSHAEEAGKPDHSTQPTPVSQLQARVGLWLSLAVAFGAFVATWPLMGVSDGYVFPSVFCVINLQQPGLGAVYVATYLFMVSSLSQGVIRVLRSQDKSEGQGQGQSEGQGQGEREGGRLRLICAALTGQALLLQLVPLFIAFSGFAGYNTCHHPSITNVLFGLLAFTAHLNQLLSPLFMLIWRRQMMIRTNPESSALAAVATDAKPPAAAASFAQVQA